MAGLAKVYRVNESNRVKSTVIYYARMRTVEKTLPRCFLLQPPAGPARTHLPGNTQYQQNL